MSLDPFSVVVGFLAALEAVLGAVAAVLGIREARRAGAEEGGERRAMLALVAAALVATAAAGVPLFYLLLDSWVDRWPGIMCVEGVRRIGTGTVGAARFLPGLHGAIDAAKLAVVFVAGAWLVFRRSPAARGAALAAVALGAVGVLDGGASLAAVVIPKEEVFPEAGCCTVARPGTIRPPVPEGWGPGPLAPGFIAAAAGLGLAALVLRRRPRGGGARTALLAALAALAAGSLPLASAFLEDAAAPALLGRPHPCRWCAFAAAPESIGATAVYLGAVFATGWALLARRAYGGGEEGPEGRLLGAAALGFLGTAAMAAAVTLLS